MSPIPKIFGNFAAKLGDAQRGVPDLGERAMADSTAATRGGAAGGTSWGLALVAAPITTLVAVTSSVAYPAIMFSGASGDYYPMAVGLALLTTAILTLVTALTSSYRGMIATAQAEPAAVLALPIAAVVAALGARGAEAQILPTVLLVLAIATLANGAVYLLLGSLRSGDLVRFLPFPVVAGFLAGVGWLLGVAALRSSLVVAPGQSLAQALTSAANLAHWLPCLALGGLLFYLQQAHRHVLNLPAVVVGGGLLFWAVALPLGADRAGLAADGWLLGGVPVGAALSGGPWPALGDVAWDLLPARLPELGAVVLVSTLALLLAVSSLEVTVRQDLDFNRELRWLGLGNLVVGLAGGMPGYTSLGGSTLSYHLGAPSRLAGVLTAVLCALLLVAGGGLLGYVPRLVVGTVLFYLALSFLADWLVDTWRRMPTGDYAVLLLVFLVTVLVDFMWAVGIGLAAGVVLFVIRYSRVSVTRSAASGAVVRSNVERPEAMRQVLEQHGDEIFVVTLQGFVFFGTASRLLSQIRERLRDPARPRLRCLVLDLHLLTGLDSSAAASLSKLRIDADELGFVILLAGAPEVVRETLRREGILEEPERRVRLFPDLDHALEWAEDQVLVAAGAMPALAADAMAQPLAAMFNSPEDRAIFLRDLERQDYMPGEVLIHQGERSDSMLFIGLGRVEVRLRQPDGRTIRVRTFESGTVVGEIAFYLGLPRSASVVAVEPTTAYRLTHETLTELSLTSPRLVAELHAYMARVIAQRLNDTTQMLRAVGG
jgi:SulP family sulfate permease